MVRIACTLLVTRSTPCCVRKHSHVSLLIRKRRCRSRPTPDELVYVALDIDIFRFVDLDHRSLKILLWLFQSIVVIEISHLVCLLNIVVITFYPSLFIVFKLQTVQNDFKFKDKVSKYRVQFNTLRHRRHCDCVYVYSYFIIINTKVKIKFIYDITTQKQI